MPVGQEAVTLTGPLVAEPPALDADIVQVLLPAIVAGREVVPLAGGESVQVPAVAPVHVTEADVGEFATDQPTV